MGNQHLERQREWLHTDKPLLDRIGQCHRVRVGEHPCWRLGGRCWPHRHRNRCVHDGQLCQRRGQLRRGPCRLRRCQQHHQVLCFGHNGQGVELCGWLDRQLEQWRDRQFVFFRLHHRPWRYRQLTVNGIRRSGRLHEARRNTEQQFLQHRHQPDQGCQDGHTRRHLQHAVRRVGSQ